MTSLVDKAFQTVQYLTIDDNRDGQRVDNYLLLLFKSVPKSHVYRILRKGEVRVNKKRIKANYRLKTGDVLRVPPMRVSERQNTSLFIDDKLQQRIRMLCQNILWQDKDLIIIDKPEGLAVHSGTNVNYGLIELLKSDFDLASVPEAAEFYEQRDQLELVHRLDQGTSGCLMVAKNRKALLRLQDIVKSRQISKRYISLLQGSVKDDHFTIDLALQNDVEISGEKMVVVDKDNGKPSVSEFTVLERFTDSTLVEVNLITGRKHQIRVHSRYIGHPVIGDKKYGDKVLNSHYKDLGLKRLFLHARSLSLSHGDKNLLVEAELPSNLAVVLNNLSITKR